MTLTRNRSVDKTRRKNSTPLEHAPEPSHADTPSSAVESQDMICQIQALMQRLPEKQRLVMHLRDVEEMAYEEIAKTLDISLDQVKVNLHRARKTIRQSLLTYIS
jgi:RNA polymerase sigma-70 factor (ECF subfamily)